MDIFSTNHLSLYFDLKVPADVGLTFNPAETGSTFVENALIKAEALYRLLSNNGSNGVWQPGDPVIADDSGVCVDALGGRPGIHSAYYKGLGTGDWELGTRLSAAERNALLLEELGDNPQRSARFVCAMVLYYGPNRFYVAQESLEGELVSNADAAKGTGGFGYDPILFIPELERTVAELSTEEKNRLSHRGKAGKAIADFLFHSYKGLAN